VLVAIGSEQPWVIREHVEINCQGAHASTFTEWLVLSQTCRLVDCRSGMIMLASKNWKGNVCLDPWTT
jgi:hypothetical protein